MNHVAGDGEGRMDVEESQRGDRRRRKDIPFHSRGETCIVMPV